MRIVKDFAKFPQPTINLNIEKGITNLMNKDEREKSKDIVNSESCENAVKIKSRSFSADDNSYLNVSIIIENNEELNNHKNNDNIDEKNEQKHELIIDSVNSEALNQTNFNLLLNNESLIVVDNDSIIHSGIPFLPCINTVKNKSFINENHDDYIINNHINNENTTRQINENTNNENKNLISVFDNDENNHINKNDDISSFINHDKTLLARSVASSSHENILNSEIAANNEGNKNFYMDDCDDAIIANFDNEYKQLTLSSTNESICINKNTSDNMNNILIACNNDINENCMKELENEICNRSNCNENEVEAKLKESKEDNDNDQNMNIEIDNNIRNEICPIGKESINSLTPEPSRTLHEDHNKTFFNPHSRPNPNLNSNANLDTNLILNNINLNKKGDIIIHLHQEDHNNIELNTVVDCPLVEGLGHEDAFKPRRSSIQVT